MKKIISDSTVRISPKAKENLNLLCEKYGLSQKDLIQKLTDLVIRNRIDPTADIVPFDKLFDRLIRLIRSIEEKTLAPMRSEVQKTLHTVSSLWIETTFGESDLPYPTLSDKIDVGSDESTLNKIHNQSDVLHAKIYEYLKRFADPEQLTKKVIAGGEPIYTAKITEQELKELQSLLKQCIIQ